jgi:hypothetical protein
VILLHGSAACGQNDAVVGEDARQRNEQRGHRIVKPGISTREWPNDVTRARCVDESVVVASGPVARGEPEPPHRRGDRARRRSAKASADDDRVAARGTIGLASLVQRKRVVSRGSVVPQRDGNGAAVLLDLGRPVPQDHFAVGRTVALWLRGRAGGCSRRLGSPFKSVRRNRAVRAR